MGWTDEDEAKFVALQKQNITDANNRLVPGGGGQPTTTPVTAQEDLARRQADTKPLEEPYVDPIDFIPAVAGSGLARKGITSLADLSGISSVPGRLMTSAVGAKYAPKIGQTLVDEGLIGTRGMIQGQVARKASQANEALEGAVKGIKGTVNSEPVAQNVMDLVKKYSTSSGYVPQEVQPEIDKILSSAADISSRGNIPAQEALDLKRIAGRVGYNRDKPLASLSANIAQKESGGYGKVLEDAFASENPGEANKISDSNARLTALIKADTGLKKKEPDNLVSKAIDLASLLHGAPPLATAANSPLVKSTAAQALQKGATAATNVAAPYIAERIPQEIGYALEPKQKQQAWSDEDEAKYQAALKSQGQ